MLHLFVAYFFFDLHFTAVADLEISRAVTLSLQKSKKLAMVSLIWRAYKRETTINTQETLTVRSVRSVRDNRSVTVSTKVEKARYS
jgi:hypothetical protein